MPEEYAGTYFIVELFRQQLVTFVHHHFGNTADAIMMIFRLVHDEVVNDGSVIAENSLIKGLNTENQIRMSIDDEDLESPIKS